MGRGENPGIILQAPTALPYDANLPYGHAKASDGYCLSVNRNAGDNRVTLSGNNQIILGLFIELHEDGKASYMPYGYPLFLRQSSAAIASGRKFLGGGDGKIKTTPNTDSTQTAARSRGVVLMPLGSADGDLVKVLLF